MIHRGIPLDRLFPDRAVKIRARLAALFKRDRLAIERGSDFANYGLAGSSGPLEVTIVSRREVGGTGTPGHPVREPEPAADPVVRAAAVRR